MYADFRPTTQFLKDGLLVNNSKCQIPEIREQSVNNDSSTNINCGENLANITFVSGQFVIINEKVLKSKGFDPASVSCCYQKIQRVEQTEQNFDKQADNKFQCVKQYILYMNTTL